MNHSIDIDIDIDIDTDTDTDTEAGFTLLEIVVGMVIFSLLTTMVFNLVTTAMDANKNAAQPVNESIATQPALTALGKAIRNSPDLRVSDSGGALYLLNQEGEYTVWHVGVEGLTNGLRTFQHIDEAVFEDVDGLIQASFTTDDGLEVHQSFDPRFPQTETIFTESFMAAHPPVS